MNPHIHTLAGNLLWEMTLDFPSWEAGRTQRAQTEAFQAGGKGVNVARMLARLGVPATALFFPGGTTGAECENWVKAKGIACQTFAVPEATRMGLVVRSQNQPETTFLGPDVPIGAAAAEACADYLDHCPEGDVLAICGSLPGWTSEACEPLRTAVDRWLRRGPVVVDTYGPPLAWLIEHPVAWVKINRAEFDGLFGEQERDQPLFNRLRLAIERWAPHAWIITDGPRPLWFAERDAPPASLTPPQVAEISSTGSGDVLHACLICSIFHDKLTLTDALRRALPYAAANAAHGAVADFPLKNLPDLGTFA
jgi:fructose-1-phosphate kinase PfkB-like protein